MKRFQKLTAVFLAVLMFAGMFTVCFTTSAAEVPAAKAQYTAADAQYPLIILPGINHSVSYVANEDGTPAVNADGAELSGGLLIIDSAGLVGKLIKKLLWPLLSSLFMQFDNGLSDAAYEVVCDLFKLQSCDKEGNQIYNLQTIEYNHPVSEMDEDTKDWFYRMLPMQNVTKDFGEENVYLYTFPLVGNPMDSAAKLVDYIEMVKAQKGVDKVNLATVSLGGTILTAYADIINGDWSNVNSIINAVALLNGTDIIADFYAREWNLSDENLYKDYVRGIMKEMNGSETLGCVINAALRLFSRKTLEGLLTGAFSGILDTLILNNPQFWAMLPKERYEALAERYLVGEEYAVLKAKADAFQQARVNLEGNLLEAVSQGVAVNSICGYNLSYTDGEYCFFGIVASSATCNSDGIIPTYSTSIGATCVPAGTSFDAAYIAEAQANGTAKYISPDGSCDASTCLFPDNTWFFNGQHHETGYNDVVFSLLKGILLGTVTDVNSSAAFPQYNGHRSTKDLTRWDMPDARDVMANEEGTYSAEQIAIVEAAYLEAEAFLANSTILGENAQEEADAVTKKLQNALVEVGAREAEAESSTVLEDGAEIVLKFADDLLFKTVGGQGYTDFFPFGFAK